MKKRAKQLEEHRSMWGGVFVVGLVVAMALLYVFYSGWIVRMWIPGTTAWPSPTPVTTPKVTPVPAVG